MDIKSKLTGTEIQDLVRLLEKVQLPAPYPVFIALCKSIPLIAIDLAVMPDNNHILLTYREDEYYKNWHIPGSILCYQETVEEAQKRVAEKELGMSLGDARFVSYFNYFDVREHGMTLLFVMKPTGEPIDGKYFKIDELPKKFLRVQEHEIEFLKNLRNINKSKL